MCLAASPCIVTPWRKEETNADQSSFMQIIFNINLSSLSLSFVMLTYISGMSLTIHEVSSNWPFLFSLYAVFCGETPWTKCNSIMWPLQMVVFWSTSIKQNLFFPTQTNGEIELVLAQNSMKTQICHFKCLKTTIVCFVFPSTNHAHYFYISIYYLCSIIQVVMGILPYLIIWHSDWMGTKMYRAISWLMLSARLHVPVFQFQFISP